MNTLDKNREGFTDKEVKGAMGDLYGLRMIRLLSERDFKNMVRLNIIVNCTVTHSNIMNTKKIFDPDVNYLKGKSVKSKPVSVARNCVKILQDILKLHKNMELFMDIMFINKLSYLVSISRGIKLTTI